MLRSFFSTMAFLVGISLWMSGCGPSGSASSQQGSSTPKAPREVPAFAQPLEEAHGAAKYLKRDALRFEFAMRFGDHTLLAEVVMKTDMSLVKMQTDDNKRVVYDGEYAYLTPGDAEWDNPRFDVLTWPYFLTAPFKLADKGTNIEELGAETFLNRPMQKARLTFEEGVGDSPDDWYVLYRDDSTNLLRGMVYIVTFSREQEEAEKNPHAVTYHLFTEIDGVTFPTEMKFWDWTDEAGLGKQLGTARIGNFRFMTSNKLTFGIPLGYKKFDSEGKEVE